MNLVKLLLLSATSTSLLLGASDRAQAYSLFFGEDLNSSWENPLTTYPSATQAESAFLSNLVNVGTETFEHLSYGQQAPISLDFGAAGIATLGGDGYINNVPSGETNGFGRYAVSWSQYWETNAAQESFYINFSQETAAFGFYGVDLGDFGGELKLRLSLVNGGETVISIPNTVGSQASTDGSVLFFGLIVDNATEAFNRIAFDMTAPGVNQFADIFAFDNMTIGSLEQVVNLEPSSPWAKNSIDSEGGETEKVPEPTSIIGLTLFGTIAMRLRRQKSS